MKKTRTLPLAGQTALVVGIANEYSIAYGCAKAFKELGAELAITYLNEKAKSFVEALARELEAKVFMPLDVQIPGQMEAVFASVRKTSTRLPLHRRRI